MARRLALAYFTLIGYIDKEMITHKMHLTKDPFEKIATGQKTIESRLFDEKRSQINVGDSIEFSNADNLAEKMLTKVEALYRYPTFSTLFSDFPPQKFGGESKEALLKEIEQFYSAEEQTRLGVIGIKIASKKSRLVQ